jgi:hypothetical protein
MLIKNIACIFNFFMLINLIFAINFLASNDDIILSYEPVVQQECNIFENKNFFSHYFKLI